MRRLLCGDMPNHLLHVQASQRRGSGPGWSGGPALAFAVPTIQDVHVSSRSAVCVMVLRFTAPVLRHLFLRRAQGQTHSKGAPLVDTGAGGLNLPAMLADDAVTDRQAQASALAGAAAGEEGLENVLEDFRRHPVARVSEHDFGPGIVSAQ